MCDTSQHVCLSQLHILAQTPILHINSGLALVQCGVYMVTSSHGDLQPMEEISTLMDRLAVWTVLLICSVVDLDPEPVGPGNFWPDKE
jgi:hypothetical protein